MSATAVKVCTGCGRELPLPDFVRDRRASDGHTSVCRSCQSARVLAGKRKARQVRFDPRRLLGPTTKAAAVRPSDLRLMLDRLAAEGLFRLVPARHPHRDLRDVPLRRPA